MPLVRGVRHGRLELSHPVVDVAVVIVLCIGENTAMNLSSLLLCRQDRQRGNAMKK